MKSQTLLKAWAAFGIFWFIIFSVFTFTSQGVQTVAVIAAITLYAGMILAVISIAFLIYGVLRLPTKKPKMKISKSE